MVQRGGLDQLVDILLIGWWWGKWEWSSSTFWFQPVWGLRACRQHTVNFSHLVGVSVSANQLKGIVMCIPWGGTRTLPQGCIIASWLLLPCFHILLFPDWQLFEPALWNSGVGSWRLNEAYFLQTRNGGHRKAFVSRAPQGPAGFQRELSLAPFGSGAQSCFLQSVRAEMSDKMAFQPQEGNFHKGECVVVALHSFPKKVFITTSLNTSHCLQF